MVMNLAQTRVLVTKILNFISIAVSFGCFGPAKVWACLLHQQKARPTQPIADLPVYWRKVMTVVAARSNEKKIRSKSGKHPADKGDQF